MAIGRSSDYYGPRGTGTIAGDTVFGAALAGKTVRWPGSLDAPHTFNYLPDMARALVDPRRARGGRRRGLAPAGRATRSRAARFLDLVSEATGRPVKASVTSRTTLRVIGLFSPFIRELAETVYQFEGPFVSDASKFERAFGPFGPTPHTEAVARTVAWFRARQG